VLLVVAASWSNLAFGQDDIVAFGDSITLGPFPFDEDDIGGYPTRLQDLLRSEGMEGVKVYNEGLSSETTSAGLSRLNFVLAARDDVGTYILMEGTNDVTRISRGELSLESTVSNLEAMAAKVRSQAIVALYSTIIPRPSWARLDKNNSVTFSLVRRLRDLTSSGNRILADPFEYFENEGAPGFKKIYFCCDPVGHPDASGFDFLAQIFADKILGNDTLAPTISLFSKTGTGGVLRAGDRLQAVVHESGTGIVEAETYFTVNGRAVATDVTGSKRRVELDYRVAGKDIACAGRITVRTEDQADPPNIRNRTMAELGVANATVLKGDVNGDCRVDGFDLSLMGLAFGSKFGEVQFSFLADTNNDKKVDGDDLAKLARNFGKSSDS
jgi:hypothetical protein